jgi:thiamine-monophosphate kinase
VNEFNLIQNLLKKLPHTTSEVIAGAGDDAAVIKLTDSSYLLATTDSQVDGVHFLSRLASPRDIGRKSIAVNVSDIAAMGGWPAYCLVSLILPKKIDETYADKLYDGIIEECKRYEVQIIGGNISRGQELVVDLFMLGKTTPSQLLLRSGAKRGDKILVTGGLGEAAAGLQLLLNPKLEIEPELKHALLAKQFTPTARLKEARVIADQKQATAMIDISDGLGQDLAHICESSDVGVRIYEEKIPVSNAVNEVAGKLGKKGWELALGGGEDYELCFTAHSNAVDNLISTVKQKTGTNVSVIGEILAKQEGKSLVLKNGETIPLPVKGWDHFSGDYSEI